jgi:HEAT repeat protein
VCVAALACGGADPGYGGRSSGDWAAVLADTAGGASERVRAAEALGHVLEIYPRASAALDALIRSLRDTSDVIRLAAGQALSREGVRAKGIVEGLAAALGDSAHADVRAQAAGILGAVGRRDPAAIPLLVRALRDPTPDVRGAGARALSTSQTRDPKAVDALVAMAARDSSAWVRATAVGALDALPAPAGRALPTYLAAIRDTSSVVRHRGIAAMTSLGAAAAPAARSLAALLTDADPAVRGGAATALGQVGRVVAAPYLGALRRLRADPDRAVRTQAEAAVATLEGRAPPREIEPSRRDR